MFAQHQIFCCMDKNICLCMKDSNIKISNLLNLVVISHESCSIINGYPIQHLPCVLFVPK